MLLRLFRKIKEQVYDFIVSIYYFWDARKRNRKYVVMGNPIVGIGNRINALANTYAWFGKENISLVWSMDEWMPAKFDDLFEMSDAPGFESVSHKRNRWSRYLQIPMLPEKMTKWWQLWVPNAFARTVPKGNIFCLYNDMPNWAYDAYKPFFSQLRPSAAVRKRIEEQDFPPDLVRVQIRNSTAKCDAAGVASVRTFIKAMKEYPAETKFYVSCMNEKVSELVREEFPGRVFELPNKDYTSMIDATADMWHLGGGSEMICQHGSAFAENAWWWRGCRSKVNAIRWEYVQSAL